MSDTREVLHVARLGECTTQQAARPDATTAARRAATTPLRAAALRVLTRNRECNTAATPAGFGVQQAPSMEPAAVASRTRLGEQLAELNGLFARVARAHPGGPVEIAAAEAMLASDLEDILGRLRGLEP